ncbi:MAG: sodium-independent anion transporter, partial [Candidatus Binatota bacterium]|nr:sodium-independent anion transporter [Candidatus Binatota bacterium]
PSVDRYTYWCFLLDAESMPLIDSTGAATLEEVCKQFAEKGLGFAVASAKGPLRVMLDRTGLTQQIGSTRFFPTLGAAVEALKR